VVREDLGDELRLLARQRRRGLADLPDVLGVRGQAERSIQVGDSDKGLDGRAYASAVHPRRSHRGRQMLWHTPLDPTSEMNIW